jgi:hypothetical protein
MNSIVSKAVKSLSILMLWTAFFTNPAEARIAIFYSDPSAEHIMPLTLEMEDGMAILRFCKSESTLEDMNSFAGCNGASPDVKTPEKNFKNLMITQFEAGLDTSLLAHNDELIVLQGRNPEFKNSIACSNNNRTWNPKFYQEMCNHSLPTSTENHENARAIVKVTIDQVLSDMNGSHLNRVMTDQDRFSLPYGLLSFAFAPETTLIVKFQKWQSQGQSALNKEIKKVACARQDAHSPKTHKDDCGN